MYHFPRNIHISIAVAAALLSGSAHCKDSLKTDKKNFDSIFRSLVDFDGSNATQCADGERLQKMIDSVKFVAKAYSAVNKSFPVPNPPLDIQIRDRIAISCEIFSCQNTPRSSLCEPRIVDGKDVRLWQYEYAVKLAKGRLERAGMDPDNLNPLRVLSSAAATDPVQVIRDLLLDANLKLSARYVRNRLGLNTVDARSLLDGLEHAGLIRATKPDQWCFTVLGNSLMLAPEAGITRDAAKRLLDEMKQRAVEINQDDSYLWGVAIVAVFGSYLEEGDDLAGLDVGVSLIRKAQSDTEYRRQLRGRSRKIEGLEQPNNAQESALWPRYEVAMALSGESSDVTVHGLGDVIAGGCEYTEVFRWETG